ncbi:MAG: VCBS repeat-containing protein [Planctomycetes bacterium]|nr:VCBS repeat-containing protein [Planctomycetota bacterium]
MLGPKLIAVLTVIASGAPNASAQDEPLYRGELLPVGAMAAVAGSNGSALGDVNHDGSLDLVTVDTFSPTQTVLLGDGLGGFGTKLLVPIFQVGIDCALGDVDSDGHPDLLTLNTAPLSVAMRRGNGLGGFVWTAGLVTGLSGHSRLHLADLDGDGKLDIVAIGAPGVSLRLSHPDLYLPPKVLSLGTVTSDAAVADFDADGDLDLAVTSLIGGNVHVLLGDGLGGFSATTTYACGFHPRAIATDDLDGDGKLDLAVANESSDDVTLLRGNGAGAFATWMTLPVDAGPRAITIADADSDGALDVVVGCTVGRTVDVWNGDGHGNFATKVVLRAGVSPNVVHAADRNADGRIDLLTTSTEGPVVCSLLARPHGSFESTFPQRLGAPAVATISADFDGDQSPDLVSAHAASGEVRFSPSPTGPAFAPTGIYPVGFAPRLLAAADYDGDGALDVACVGPGTARVLRGDGAGNFTLGSTSTVNFDPCELTVGDTNGDGLPDLVVASADVAGSALDLLRSDGVGGFLPASSIAVGSWQDGAALGDWDGDGALDLVVSLPTLGQVRLLLGDGHGGFAASETWPLGSPGDVVLGYFDEDDALDVAAITGARSVTIHAATAVGSHVWSKPVELSVPLEELVIGDFDFDTHPDVLGLDTSRGLVAAAFGDGVGGLQGVRSFQIPLGAADVTVDDFDRDGGLDVLVPTPDDAGAALLRNLGACLQRSYCEAKVSLDGCYPTIGSSGTPSASATSGFVITCTGAVEQQPGALLYSLSGAANVPFAGGVLCLAGPIDRTLYSNSGGVLPCEGSFSVDFNAFAAGLFGAHPRPELRVPGTAVYAQWWGIDTDFAPPQDRQLSDALAFHLCP